MSLIAIVRHDKPSPLRFQKKLRRESEVEEVWEKMGEKLRKAGRNPEEALYVWVKG